MKNKSVYKSERLLSKGPECLNTENTNCHTILLFVFSLRCKAGAYLDGVGNGVV